MCLIRRIVCLVIPKASIVPKAHVPLLIPDQYYICLIHDGILPLAIHVKRTDAYEVFELPLPPPSLHHSSIAMSLLPHLSPVNGKGRYAYEVIKLPLRPPSFHPPSILYASPSPL